LPKGIVVTSKKVVRPAGGRVSHFLCRAITRILLHIHIWYLAQ
jgi:hypothetical protein